MRITSDLWVLKVVSQGYSIQFLPSPSPFRECSHKCPFFGSESELLNMTWSCGGSTFGVKKKRLLWNEKVVGIEEEGLNFHPLPRTAPCLRPTFQIPYGYFSCCIPLPGSIGLVCGSLSFTSPFTKLRFLVGTCQCQYKELLPFGLSTFASVHRRPPPIPSSQRSSCPSVQTGSTNVSMSLPVKLACSGIQKVKNFIYAVLLFLQLPESQGQQGQAFCDPDLIYTVYLGSSGLQVCKSLLNEQCFLTMAYSINQLCRYPRTPVKSCLKLMGCMEACIYVAQHLHL